MLIKPKLPLLSILSFGVIFDAVKNSGPQNLLACGSTIIVRKNSVTLLTVPEWQYHVRTQ
jgi:hypothetical protein